MKTFLILTVIDVISAFRIMWLDVNTQYAPLSTDDNLYGLPLIEETYNLMVFVLLINIAVVFYKLIRKRYQQANKKWRIITLFLYSIVSFLCMAIGYYYIGLKTHECIINEYNILFRLPISLLGRDFIQRTLTVENLYTTLCITLISINFSYIILFIKSHKRLSRNND